ncbi:MAG: hypothetical protein EOM12_12030 [Verrucomicrobiae bacterium]|nr:hypothetical protein [Verrucomicrobiae bacterium]
MKILFALSCVLAISACTTNPDIGSLSSTQRANLASLEVYKGVLPQNRPYEVVGEAKGLSCFRNAYQVGQHLTEEEAMQGVKLNAAKLGADAVINTFCQRNSGTDWANNCWASFVCAGDAIRYTH